MTWADVKANIVMKLVTAPVTSDPWEIHAISRMLMECDRGAQGSFFL